MGNYFRIVAKKNQGHYLWSYSNQARLEEVTYSFSAKEVIVNVTIQMKNDLECLTKLDQEPFASEEEE